MEVSELVEATVAGLHDKLMTMLKGDTSMSRYVWRKITNLIR